jgi:hypothetical protein
MPIKTVHPSCTPSSQPSARPAAPERWVRKNLINQELQTIALLQQHLAQLLFALNTLPDVEAMVQEGLLGNAAGARDAVRLNREAIKKLAEIL